MTDKEKYRAKIEAQLMNFGESLYEITTCFVAHHSK